MNSKEYWRHSLEEVLSEPVTDELVDRVMSIAEMEYEYTQSESMRKSKEDPNQLKIKELEKKIRIYENALCVVHKADSVDIVGGRVEWFRRINQ